MVGRVDVGDPERPKFQWSGTGAVANFEGSQLGVTLRDDGNQFTVVLDGALLPTLVTQSGLGNYSLATELSAGPHTVELYRQTEASFGPTEFLGFDFGPDGRALAPPTAQRHIELIGDSVSTAYGNLGQSTACGFSAETQDHYLSYGAISARELQAELSTIASSGKGVVFNYDDAATAAEPMPALYDRVFFDDPSSQWDYSRWQADAVVINLGTNDFSTDVDPSEELFSEEYFKLLQRVRQHYPQALILCTVGPLLNGQDQTDARNGIRLAVAQFESEGGNEVAVWEMTTPNTAPGCDYHPSVSTHQLMAAEMTRELRAALKW